MHACQGRMYTRIAHAYKFEPYIWKFVGRESKPRNSDFYQILVALDQLEPALKASIILYL